MRRAAQLPLEATGLAYLPKAALAASAAARDAGLAGAKGAAFVRVDGAAEPLGDKLAHLAREFAGRDATVHRRRRHRIACSPKSAAAQIFAGSESDLWRLCVPPSEAAAAAEAAGAALWFADWAGGLLWLELPATTEIAIRLRADRRAHRRPRDADARARAKRARGLRCSSPSRAARARLTQQVKAAFDPNRVLNPGRMYEDV